MPPFAPSSVPLHPYSDLKTRSPLISLCLASLLSFGTSSSPATTQSLEGTIVNVGDGDTIRVRTTEKTLTVRLACINAPEMAQAPYGQAAANRLKKLLPVGQDVTLRVANTDRYGRSVAKVYKESLSINVALVQEGQAAVYQQYLSACPELRDLLLSAQIQAKQRRLGLWAQANPEMPWDFRQTSTAKPRAPAPVKQQRST